MIMQQSRRQWLVALFALPMIVMLSTANSNANPTVNVAKTATCGCCQIWIDYIRKEGFKVDTKNMASGQLSRFKSANGIQPEFASCHTARVGGYTIEGHVPVREIKRLLSEQPDAVGLAVPGMPLGSPGMEFGADREPYDVLLIGKDGTASVYASYGKKS